MGLCLWKKKGPGTSIDQGTECLAGSQVCLPQVTRAQAGSPPGAHSHCKVLLSVTEGTGSRDKENKDPSPRSRIPWEPLGFVAG